MVLLSKRKPQESKVTYLGPKGVERRLPRQRGCVYSLLSWLHARGPVSPVDIAFEKIPRNRGVDSKVVHFPSSLVASSTSIKEGVDHRVSLTRHTVQ